MTRDIEERLTTFIQGNMQVYNGFSPGSALATTRDLFKVERIALTMDQIEEFSPPPNPAKVTDSRAAEYVWKYGRESWELDALTPSVLEDLVTTNIRKHLDIDVFNEQIRRENEESEKLEEIGERWPEIEKFLEENPR